MKSPEEIARELADGYSEHLGRVADVLKREVADALHKYGEECRDEGLRRGIESLMEWARQQVAEDSALKD